MQIIVDTVHDDTGDFRIAILAIVQAARLRDPDFVVDLDHCFPESAALPSIRPEYGSATSADQPAAPPPPLTVAQAMGAVDLDAEGLPWDARIHSGGKSRTAKGVWARRKNTDDATWIAVRKELAARATVSAPPPPVAPAAPPPPAPVVVAPPAPPPPPPVAPPVISEDGKWQWIDGAWQPYTATPVAPAAPPPPPTPAAPAVPAAGTMDWPSLMRYVVPRLTPGSPTPLVDSQLMQVAAELMGTGTQWAQLATRPDLIPQAYARLQQM